MSKFVTVRGARALRYGVAVSVIAAAMGVAGAAAAQSAPADDDSSTVEEVVVTGFRGSLRAALDIKREEAAVVDVIKAEDIADFPDNNLAESIQRIPGVSIDRDAGEGRTISVRGLGPEFTRVRLNGMEALATTGGTDSSGGTNRGRGFDFNVFASELFNSITVRKTPSADVDEGSLGATVDLQTARPFDYKGFTMALSGQGAYNDLSGNIDPRAAFLISDTWFDGKLGALFSVAYSQKNSLEEGHSTVRWQNGALACQLGSATTISACPTEVNTGFTPRLPRYGVLNHEQERLGMTAALQWRPTDRTKFDLDVLYADFKANRMESFLEAPDFSASNNCVNPTTGATLNCATAGAVPTRGGIIVRDYAMDGKDIVYGRFDGVDVRSENRYDEQDTQFTQVTLNGSHEITDSLILTGMLGRAVSDYVNPIQTTLLFDKVNSSNYVYDYRGNDNLPLITYGFDVNDPASWKLSQIRMRPQTAYNSFDTAQGELKWYANDAVTVKGGIDFKKYYFKTTEQRRSNGTTGNQEATIPGLAAGAPIAGYSRSISLADSWDIPGGTPLTWLIPDYHTAAFLLQLNDRSIYRMGPEPALGNNRTVNEEELGAYVQADFKTEVAGLPLRGNVGVRYVETDQGSTGYQVAAGTPVKVSVDRSYTDVLPSANIVLEPTDSFLIRAGVAKVMARPGLGNLTPGGSVSVSGNNRTVSSGNPFLDPTRATTYDLSFEWYFQDNALLSLGLFRKDIDSFVATASETRPFTGNALGVDDSVAIAACGALYPATCSPSADWVFSQPVNTKGGELKGFEINYQQPFTFLPGVWEHFGVLANYTYVESEVAYPGGIKESLTGLSKNAYNGTVYYEDDRLSARVSASYRDGYLQRVPGQNGNSVEGKNETFNVDMSASYAVSDNFSLTLEGINLTDEVNDQYVDASDRVYVYHHTGRQYFFGFRYKY